MGQVVELGLPPSDSKSSVLFNMSQLTHSTHRRPLPSTGRIFSKQKSSSNKNDFLKGVTEQNKLELSEKSRA